MRRPHEFKIACLQEIRPLLPDEWNPFYAGFGNRDTCEVAQARWRTTVVQVDAVPNTLAADACMDACVGDVNSNTCREIGVPLNCTFTIKPKGQIRKASTAVQSSTWSSLSAINDLVDEMFPALLQPASSNISRGLHSVYSSFQDTLEFAAPLGAVVAA